MQSRKFAASLAKPADSELRASGAHTHT